YSSRMGTGCERPGAPATGSTGPRSRCSSARRTWRELSSPRRTTFARTTLDGKERRTMAAAALDLKGVRSMRPKLRNGDRPPRRLPNAAVRSREYLTADEVERLIAAARG